MLAWVLKLLGPAAEWAASAALKESAKAAWSRRRYILLGQVSSHFRDLQSKMKDMPFIYHDLEKGEILNEFVEEDIANLDLGALHNKTPKHFSAGGKQRIRDTRRALILGSAGIGKTTFLRRTTLGLAKGKGRSTQFLDREYLIPFYVPLKALDLGHHSPILRYLLLNYPLLAGRSGLRKLTRLAERKKVLLLLDGYDEIPFPMMDGEDHQIRTELNRLMEPSRGLRVDRGSENPTQRLYRLISDCRVWLTSRIEFFELYKLRVADERPHSGLVQTVAVELRGVGENRFKLVTSIFEKYKKRSARYKDLLSTEYFVQSIDRSNEPDLIHLSYNPLFLTVMCYIYATKVNEANTFEVNVGANMREVVFTCTSLLLSDLDKDKARGLSQADEKAYAGRRNEYVAEKESFLRFFANAALCGGKTSFDLTYLTSEVVKFFAHESDAANAGAIAGQPSRFAHQLVFSGIFVSVDRNAQGTLYDFPHRRFREVLAGSYFDSATPDRRASLLEVYLRRTDLIETLFSVSVREDEILGTLLQKSLEVGPLDYTSTLKSVCARGKSDSHTHTLQTFLSDCVEKNIVPPIAWVMPELLVPEKDFLARLVMSLESSLAKGRLSSLVLASFLLSHFDGPLLRTWIAEKLDVNGYTPSVRAVLLAHAAMVDRDLFLAQTENVRASRNALSQLCYVAARSLDNMATPADRVDFCKALLSRLTDSESAAFFYFLAKYNNPALNEAWDILSSERELAAAVIRSLLDVKDTGHSDDCYVVTSRLIEGVGREAKELLRAKRGKVYSELNFSLEGLLEPEKIEIRRNAKVQAAVLADMRNKTAELAQSNVELRCCLTDFLNPRPKRN
jgi:NACHT domain